MTANPHPYPTYKPSGVEWVDDVPAHWQVHRISTLADILNGATPSTGTPEYWNGGITWITPEDLGRLEGRFIAGGARRITVAGYESCGTTLAPAGSIALSTRAPIGHLGILSSGACVNQGCRLLSLNGNIQSEYLYYALLAFRPYLQSHGEGSTFTELSRVRLSGFRIPLPPLPEQSAIVRYLDHTDSRIQRYINAKERLIELLTEQKQAIIYQAVTRGLDPNVPLKPSGVQWLGDVPAHWEVLPIKRAFTSIDYGISESSSNSGSIRLLTMGNIKEGRVAVPNLGGVDSVAESLLLRRN